MSAPPKRIIDEAAVCFGKMLMKGQVLSATEVYWNAAICRDVIAAALIAAEQRGREEGMATIVAVHDILRADDRYGALAHLPAGGIECEEMVEKAVDLLATAIRTEKDKG